MRTTAPSTRFLIAARRVGRTARRLLPIAAIAGAGAGSLLCGLGLARRHAPERTVEAAGKLEVGVLNVQLGEASFARTPNGRFIVIGAGPPGQATRILTALNDAGAKRIDLLCLPYPYAEAIGSAGDIIAAFPVDRVIEAPGSATLNRWQVQVHALCQQKHIPLVEEHAGDISLLDGVTLSVLAPGPQRVAAKETAANNSLVLRLKYGATAFLWAGGLDRAGEDALLSRTPELSADWLRVARFGTANASSSEFLKLVSPDYAVVSVGPNPLGYPSQDTLTRLQAIGSVVYRTDAQPDPLLFYSDGTHISAPAAP